MRLLFVILIALVGLVQYPLWVGKGGWFRVWELQGELAEQRYMVEGLRARNAALAAEVEDLRSGTGALEERARGDLGMMREGEVFVQILPHNEAPPSGALTAGGAPAARTESTTHNPARGIIGAAPPSAGAGAHPARPSQTGAARPAGSASAPSAGASSPRPTGTATPRPGATPAGTSGANRPAASGTAPTR